jgi:Ser-tRNA(Ala) deacylase AlaX
VTQEDINTAITFINVLVSIALILSSKWGRDASRDPVNVNQAIQKIIAAERDIDAVMRRLNETLQRVIRLEDQFISVERRIASSSCSHDHFPDINISGGVGRDVVGRDRHDGHRD